MTQVDFAAAQARVTARRSARLSALRERDAHQQDRVARSRIPPSIAGPTAAILSIWETATGREGTRPAFRVGQVDAELLDEELLDLFKEQVGEALKYFGPHLREEWGAEIQLALRALLFKLTIWDHDASYGAALQNLRYADARSNARADRRATYWQKALYGLLSVGGRYAWAKWEDRMLDIEGGYEEVSPLMKRLSHLSGLASTAHSMAAFASFLVFLVNGKYRTVLDRILRLQLLPTTSSVAHEVSFEYLNRQLVWHAFTEFLLFLLPLVGISRWKRLLGRAWKKVVGMVRGSEGEKDGIPSGELGFLPERTCAICYKDQNPAGSSETDAVAMSAEAGGVVGSSATDITNPYETVPCGCVYDFVCLAQRLDAEDGQGWTCLRCGEVVRECKPWHGDVVHERSRPSSGKSVTFADSDSVDKAGESFARLEPIPDEDEREAEIGEEIEEDSERRASLEGVRDGGDDVLARDGTPDDDGEDAEMIDPTQSLVQAS